MGFFTDTTVCIGCKACEVACKQWNDLPSDGASFKRGGSYDHTASLGATTWRHVRFVELLEPSPLAREEAERALADGAGGQLPDLVAMAGGNGHAGAEDDAPVDIAAAVADMDRWVFMSDVCKHCTNAGCMDACPTGALIRTEFETVVLQADVCNGCGYCIPSCPFGVVDRSPEDGRAAKCTLCYDRLQDGLEPACAKACPTQSIQFGPLDELRERAAGRLGVLREAGVADAHLYGADPDDGVGGFGAFFLLLDKPEVYGLPPDPVVTTRDLPGMWKAAAGAALGLIGAVAVACTGRRR
jgi:formate dehydrogenase iron-sulfur subunit